MAIQTVNIGTTPNDGTGDTPRAVGQKFNDNFSNADHAASRLVTSTSIDTTAGRLLKVGDGGLITSIALTNEDLNTVIHSGFYRLNNSHTNGPYPLGGYGQLIVSRGSDTISQIFSDWSVSELYVRTGNPPDVGGAGAWNPWAKVLTNLNTSVIINEDYEEGTWTPTLSWSGGGAAPTVSSTANTVYTKIGNTVHINGYISISAAGSELGILKIEGLPKVNLDDYTLTSVWSTRTNSKVLGGYMGSGETALSVHVLGELGSPTGAGVLTSVSELGLNFSYTST